MPAPVFNLPAWWSCETIIQTITHHKDTKNTKRKGRGKYSVGWLWSSNGSFQQEGEVVYSETAKGDREKANHYLTG
jgi:hypothetical protein